MESHTLLPRYIYTSTSSTSTRTTIIAIVCILVALKIALLIWICHRRSKKRAQRRALGCQCYDNTDYYCLPMCNWNGDRHCKCGRMQTRPSAYGHGSVEYDPAPPYARPAGQLGYRRDMEAGVTGYDEPVEMQPAYGFARQGSPMPKERSQV